MLETGKRRRTCMRARDTILLALALTATTLAGCLSDEPDDLNTNKIQPALIEEGLNAAHSSYEGFGIAAALQSSPDGKLNQMRDDGVLQWFKPEYRGIPDVLTRVEPVAHVEGTTTGGGITVFGPLAFIGGRSQGPMSVVNIIDPSMPEVIGVADDVPVRDADTILFPDGRLVVITTAGGSNIFATDASDPANPELIGNFETPGGNHNIAVVPGTPIVYNTAMDIIDFGNPESPQLMGTFEGGDGCHDIAFSIDRSADRYWALCAGYAQTEIWDIQDPLAPVLKVAIDYPSVDKGLPVVGGELDDAGVPQNVGEAIPCTPVGNVCPDGAFPLSFSHLAILNHDATVLIMGDETGGGGINGCDFYFEGADGQTYSGPIGNLWFYDITDPENPDLRGHVSPGFTDASSVGTNPMNVDPANTDPTGDSCTAHFGQTIEDTPFLVMGFYTAGVVLVDFSDLDNPRITDRWDEETNIWDVQYYQGYLFTGDIARGMDVLSLSG